MSSRPGGVLVGRWVALLACLTASTALAADVAVSVRTGAGPVDRRGAEAVVWHALEHGHDLQTLVVPPSGERTWAAALREEGVRTHLDVTVQWKKLIVDVGEGMKAATPSPEVIVVERVLVDDQLVVRARWRAVGAPAVFRVAGVDDGSLLTLPDASLQTAVATALSQLTVPAWGDRDAALRVPVVVAADPAYRAAYGPGWRAEAARRVLAGSRILAQAGLALDVVGFQAWEGVPDDGSSGVPSLAEQLDALQRTPNPLPAAALRIAFVEPPPGSRLLDGAEDVGRAFTPGVDVVVADQPLPPGHPAQWDLAGEGVIVAHEVLHALGAPHEDAPGFVMSARKVGLAWRLTPRTVQLARVAAEARLVHWDPATALLALSAAAERWLADTPRAQLAYVVDNLRVPPAPGAVDPARASALANAALAHSYTRMADQDATDADLHRSIALAHVQAAIAMQPSLSTDLDAWLPDAAPGE